MTGGPQFGNTCYCNSVLQALYFCKPFRLLTQRYVPAVPPPDETLLTCLTELYNKIGSQKKRTGSVAPRRFVAKLRKENGALSVHRLRASGDGTRRTLDSGRPRMDVERPPFQSSFGGTTTRTPTSS